MRKIERCMISTSTRVKTRGTILDGRWALALAALRGMRSTLGREEQITNKVTNATREERENSAGKTCQEPARQSGRCVSQPAGCESAVSRANSLLRALDHLPVR